MTSRIRVGTHCALILDSLPLVASRSRTVCGGKSRDWEGGEFILVEQQPSAQSKAEVVSAKQGQAIIFTTRYRPVKGAHGYYRVNLRHGVSRVHRGTRYTLGIIFHDAK